VECCDGESGAIAQIERFPVLQGLEYQLQDIPIPAVNNTGKTRITVYLENCQP
jgi:hypothetical protein